MKPSVAILGAGAMGRNLAHGLLSAGWTRRDIVLADKFAEPAAEAHRVTGIEVLLDAVEASSGRDVIVVAVKPNDVRSLLASIAGTVVPHQVVVSLAAGVPLSVLEAPLAGVPVVRTMPNTPASVGQAMTAYSGGKHADAGSLALAAQVLAAVGETVEVTEDLLDAVTAVSGSGPAYVFLLAEALTDAAVREGLAPDAARLLVAQTLRGAGLLLAVSDKDAATLRREVTSPGGTTEAALGVFEEGGFRDLIARAVREAAERSRELGRDAAES